jgi:hypothetical protein
MELKAQVKQQIEGRVRAEKDAAANSGTLHSYFVINNRF